MTEQQTNPIEENKIGEIRKCLRKSDLENILGVKRTTRQRITRLPGFPKSFKLGGTCEVWDSEEVYQWLESQKAEHGGNEEPVCKTSITPPPPFTYP